MVNYLRRRVLGGKDVYEHRERWILEWLKKGDNDLRAAGAIEDAPFDVICFHAQHCFRLAQSALRKQR